MSFDKIHYRGQELSELKVDDSTAVAYYRHIYRGTYGSSKGTHACLQIGSWCTKQAAGHPIVAIRFLVRKLTSKLKGGKNNDRALTTSR